MRDNFYRGSVMMQNSVRTRRPGCLSFDNPVFAEVAPRRCHTGDRHDGVTLAIPAAAAEASLPAVVPNSADRRPCRLPQANVANSAGIQAAGARPSCNSSRASSNASGGSRVYTGIGAKAPPAPPGRP